MEPLCVSTFAADPADPGDAVEPDEPDDADEPYPEEPPVPPEAQAASRNTGAATTTPSLTPGLARVGNVNISLFSPPAPAPRQPTGAEFSPPGIRVHGWPGSPRDGPVLAVVDGDPGATGG